MNKKQKRILLIIIGVLLIIAAIILLVKVFTSTKTYTITFDTNGGSNVSSLEIKEKDLIVKPEDPTREGYTFAGWYLNDELYDFTSPVKENLTLEARWSENATELSLNATSLALKVGEEATLKASIMDGLTWKSSDESIVSVDANGKLKALKAGEVTITVTDKNGQRVTCKISVTEKKADEVEVTKVEITGAKDVTVGSKIKLTVKITPNNATDKKVTWKSSNTKIAKVDANGNVTGVKDGKVTITVTSENGKSASVTITVKAKASTSTGTNPKPSTGSNTGTGSGSTGGNTGSGSTGGGTTTPQTVPVTSVTLSGASSVNVGASTKLTVTINPSNATNKKYTCAGDDSSVATVTDDCRVTGKNDGTVTVTVTTADGKHTAKHKVTVNSVYGFTLIPEDMGAGMGVTRYQYKITKNGNAFKKYEDLTLNRVDVFGSTIQATIVENSNKVSFKDQETGKTVSLTVAKP